MENAKLIRRMFLILACLAWLLGGGPMAAADQYVALSLQQAERHIRRGTSPLLPQAKRLGGISDPVALVYDSQSRDLILVGKVDPAARELTIDDLVVALRAILEHETWPLVSIDKDERTDQTKRQTVRFEGGIADSSFGMDALKADELLKNLAFGDVDAEVWGVISYFEMLCRSAERGKTRGHVTTKFWFIGDEYASGFCDREGVMVIDKLDVAVEARVVGTLKDVGDRRATGRDELGVEFSTMLSHSYDDLAQEFPILRRIRTLYKLVGLATGVMKLEKKYPSFRPDLSYWRNRYEVSRLPTPTDHPLVEKEKVVPTNAEPVRVRLDGGLELKPLLLDLQDGSLAAFRDVVLTCRPDPSAMVWRVPLECWKSMDVLDATGFPGDQELDALVRDFGGQAGVTLDAYVGSPRGPFSPRAQGRVTSLAEFRPGIPSFKHEERVPSTPNIGGVMLSGTADVEGADGTQVNLAGGNFSLVVDGENARIDPKLFRKFITALWCVYYSEQDPGISIDPPGRNTDDEVPMEEFMKPEKHSVRYIGRVLNTDLGRVMREADYLMKKWAVGSGRPEYSGFRSVDAYSARLGAENVGVSRRFWFVPENLRFSRGGDDLLLFDAGRIRLLTEFNRDGMRGRASQADEAFASFFTEHYDGIAETAPVFEELFEYAKLVSLAKYLKQQGVPLHWFLMAHKELVLMEHSPPAEVDAFVKESDHVRGMAMKGGVDLASTPSFRNDAAAEAALRQALAHVPAARGRAGRTPEHVPTGIVTRDVSFEVAGEHYTVLPQHSLTSGRDHRGLRYQTDVALRRAGKPALELVRYFNPRGRESGQFGRGWHLLIPYHIEPVDRETRRFLNVRIPQRMAVEHRLSGKREVLAFREDEQGSAGYVPEQDNNSQIRKLMLLSDGSHRLVDKLGNQFHFDPRGRMSGMFPSPASEHQMRIEYLDQYSGAFVQPPYDARPVGEARVDFLNVRLPRQVEVRDRVHDQVEVLTFDSDHEPPGYVPEDAAASRFRVAALLSNGALELLDRHGNQIRLTRGWDFDSVLPAPERRMVRSVSMGGRRITFGYTLDAQGQVVIATAAVSQDKPDADSTWVVRYEYDDAGRLCRVRPPGDSRRPALSAVSGKDHSLPETGRNLAQR
ncbi:MAG: hypothetical protein ACOC8H_00490 [bacterium]